MVNRRPRIGTSWGGIVGVIALAAVVLTSVAWLRGAEYDEQYTLFLTAGTARPSWPAGVFRAGLVPAIQSGHASLSAIATDLRRTDVHPPLYFWLVSLWRAAAGPGLFQARMLSVLAGLISLAMVGAIARRCGIQPLPAMLLTLGCYGFAYTSIIARGFALAQALTLGGVWMLVGPRTRATLLGAGLLFGAACACNYLAVFVAAAVAATAGAWLVLPAATPFLALDTWFFAAQHGARPGQFPPFSLLAALPRLIAYQIANVFGGLPLYANGPLRLAVGAAIGTLAAALAATVLAARPWAAGPHIRMLAAAALAPPVGLLTLGLVFNNTPIELRYLSFGAPFIALLIVWGCDARRSRRLLWAAGITQCAAIAGLAVAAPTMQPARGAALAAADIALPGFPDGLITVLPHGNDGVGIVGAFGDEAQAALPLLVVRPADTPAQLAAKVAAYRRVVLALLGQDRDSTVTLPVMRQAFAGPGWRLIARGSNIEAYERE